MVGLWRCTLAKPIAQGGEVDVDPITPGAHTLKVEDGTGMVELRFDIDLGQNRVEEVTPASRRVRPGDEVVLGISPLRAGGGSYSFYWAIPKDAAGLSQRSVPVELSNDMLTFVVPNYALLGRAQLELNIDRWGQPEPASCLGASACTIQIDGEDAPNETVSLELTIEP